jgi:hypothetical protein
VFRSAFFVRSVAILGLILLAACAAPQTDKMVDPATEVFRLETAILAMGPGIDPEEAARAARIAYDYTAVLKEQYEITDPPLIHNMKVNAGLRPRGLCWHWAEDIENRLNAEEFRTLEVHRAIANADTAFLIDHSTAIIGRKGDAWDDGIVLDPWRYGGTLFWDEVTDDTRYPWVERSEVHARKRAEALRAR